MELRRLTVAYMRATADDFAPFLPDHLKFDDYCIKEGLEIGTHPCSSSLPSTLSMTSVDDLSTPGEYAGNDALVAFARAAHVDIYVHQLDQPVWIVRAVEGKVMGEQLHIAYQSYEHCECDRVRHAQFLSLANLLPASSHHLPQTPPFVSAMRVQRKPSHRPTSFSKA